MIGPRRLLLATIFTLGAAALASASQAPADIYFAQTAQGSNNGSSCANAFAYNDGGNGINVSGNWVAGNTLHLCGTISVNAGSGGISARASGSSGSPITIKFEPGAVLQAPYFGTGSSAGIYLSGRSYITIDGGNTGNASLPTTSQAYWTTGIVQNYANGTAGTSACPGINNTGGAPCSNQQGNTTGIEAAGSNNITVKNLSCSNMYVQSAADKVPNTGPDCIHFQGSNWSIFNSQLHDDGIAINNTYGNDTNTAIYNNDFQEDGWALECAGGAVTNSNYQFYNNHTHNFDRWTNGGGATHVNGIHCFNGSGGGISSMYMYNNLFDGAMGNCCWTAWVYLEANGPGDNWITSTGTLYFFNNVLVAPSGCCVNGNGMLNYGSGAGHIIANNFFYGSGTSGQNGMGPCMDFQGQNITVQNNVFENCTQLSAGPYGGNPGPTWSSSSFDYNIYSNMTGGGNHVWQVNSIGVNTLAAWQSACNCDAHAQSQLGSLLSNITNEGVPSAGYIGIQQGANLTTTATGLLAALDFDTGAGDTHTPGQRPNGTCTTQGTGSCWDIGAFQYGTGDPPPNPPTGLSAIVN